MCPRATRHGRHSATHPRRPRPKTRRRRVIEWSGAAAMAPRVTWMRATRRPPRPEASAGRRPPAARRHGRRATRRRAKNLGRERTDQRGVHRGAGAAGGQREDDIAVAHRVDRPGWCAPGRRGPSARPWWPGLSSAGRRWRRRRAWSPGQPDASAAERKGNEAGRSPRRSAAIVSMKPSPSSRRAPATMLPSGGIDDVAHRVDRDQGRHRDAADPRSTPCRDRRASPAPCRTSCPPSSRHRHRRCLRQARRSSRRLHRKPRSPTPRRVGSRRRRLRDRRGWPPARSAP